MPVLLVLLVLPCYRLPTKALMYRVFPKKALHEREEKMQEKMKMTWEKDGNLGNVQQQSSVYFCIKIIFKS